MTDPDQTDNTITSIEQIESMTHREIATASRAGLIDRKAVAESKQRRIAEIRAAALAKFHSDEHPPAA